MTLLNGQLTDTKIHTMTESSQFRCCGTESFSMDAVRLHRPRSPSLTGLPL